MTNENLPATQVNPLLDNIQNLSMKEEEEKKKEKSFLPQLKITSKLHEHFKSEEETPVGDFYLDGVTLGKELDIYIVHFCYMGLALKKGTWEFKGKIIFEYNVENIATNAKYKEFVAEVTKDPEVEVSLGANLLLYIPKLDKFCTLFCKGKILSGAGAEILTAMRSLRTCNFRINTFRPEKKKYTLLKNTPLENKHPEVLTPEIMNKQIKLLMTVSKPESSEGVEAGR
jgi:hypothetical protein